MAYLGQVDRKASNVQVFNVTSSTSATHDIGWTPPSEQTLIVTINGVKQHTNAFSFSGATLTLGAALVATDELEVIGINDIGNSLTPVDNSVTTSKLGDDSVTLAKMADGTQGGIIHYGAAGAPVELAAGTDGYFLKTQGAGANPVWAGAGGANSPAFTAYTNATLNLTDATWTKVTATTESFDVGSGYDATNSKFVVPSGEGGKYYFWSWAKIAHSSGNNINYRGTAFYKNGSSFASTMQHDRNFERNVMVFLFYTLDLSVADEIEWYAYADEQTGPPQYSQLAAGPDGSAWGCFKLIGV